MAPCEFSTRTGLQVGFEGAGLGFVAEGDGDLQIPGRELGCVRNMAAIVVLEALFEVSGAAGVDLVRMRLATETTDVGVIGHDGYSGKRRLEPTIGFEPMTCSLRVSCSTS
jgi:hypothetical protein